MATKIKSIRLPEELDNDIKALSERFNLAEMDIIRMALAAGLPQVEASLTGLLKPDSSESSKVQG